MVKKKKELSFEEALLSLERITSELETGSLSLEESLNAFKEGIELSVYCQQALEKADGSIKQLMKKADGTLELTNLELD
jgi:exodeoxyribonuclease VII small subunit